jgi:hypothetical protein
MASDNHELEELRHQLEAQVAKAKSRGSQRVSRGFHRLALFLAAIPLVAGVAISFFFAKQFADTAWQAYQKASCAHEYIDRRMEAYSPPACTFSRSGDSLDRLLADIEGRQKDPAWLKSAPDNARLDLKPINCSDLEGDTISLGEARADLRDKEKAREYLWAEEFIRKLLIGFALTLAASLAIYGVIRAIGWVIGGFAAS